MRQSLTAVLIAATLLTACAPSSGPSVDLNRVLEITQDRFNNFSDGTEASADQTANNSTMQAFTYDLAQAINQATPPLHNGVVGVDLTAEGAFQGFDDANQNFTRDDGEKDLFKIELDSVNQRFIASQGDTVQESGFSGGGFLMGMLLGNMLSRQRSSGISPNKMSAKKATPTRAAATKKAAPNARSRGGSGSFSRGK